MEQMQYAADNLFIYPDHGDYDAARQPWNRSVNQHPAVIAMARCQEDVVAAVHYARANDLTIAVQATGHGTRRSATGALLLNTAQMREVQIDAERRTAWVSAGAKWGAVLEKAQAVGLAPLLGSSSGVGAVGYTLGGGFGWLARNYGLAADSVHRFAVVTADGEARSVSNEEHADLFWGLRGGGGSLAIVTGMEIALYPVTTVFGGSLIYPGALTKEVLLHYREWVKTLPDEFSTSVAIMNYPPIPELPAFLRGQSVVMVRCCYTGPVAAGEALLEPWLTWRAPMANLVHAMPFAEVDTISNDPMDPMPSLTSGAWMRALTDDGIDALVRYGLNQQGSSPLIMTEVRHAGGAIRNVSPTSSPIGHRDANFVLCLVAATPTAEITHQVARYMAAFKTELAPELDGVYMNFLDGDETQARTKDAYAVEQYQQLMRLKAKYDPADRFSHSFNIPRAGYVI